MASEGRSVASEGRKRASEGRKRGIRGALLRLNSSESLTCRRLSESVEIR